MLFGRGVVNELRARAVEGLRSVPKRGAEVGGLLLGRVVRSKPLQVRVSGFEELPCQHRFGPSYILSEDEHSQLDAALQRERPEPVIGFFRSYTGREMLLDEADRNLLSRCFPGEHSIFLLLQPRASGSCTAAFLFPESGEIGWEPQYPPFEFEDTKLSDAAAPAAVAATVAEAPQAEAPRQAALPQHVELPQQLELPQQAALPQQAEPPPAAAPISLPPARPPRRFISADESVEMKARPRRRLLLPLVGWIATCIAAAGVYELWTMARAPRWRPLGLNALMAAGTIHLGWDAGLRPVRDARTGVLTINDGTAEKRITLTPEQVRTGKFDYRPTASDVLFRLELAGSDMQSAGDSLRLMAEAPQAAAGVHPPSPAARTPETSADRTDHEGAEPRPANVAVLPEPLTEIHPDIPPGIRARIRDRVVVPVEVKVTAAGRVTAASAHGGSGSDGLYHYLADRAAKAARQWRFSPARSTNGKPVPAARTVYFVFRGTEG